MSANETAEAIIIVIKRLAKWIIIGLLLIALLVGLIIGYFQVEYYYKNRPQSVTSIKGISLGDKLSDALFKNPGFSIDEAASKEDGWGIVYENRESRVYFRVMDGKIFTAGYFCKSEYEYTTINGISCGDTGDRLVEKYGNDLRVQCLRDKKDKQYLNYRVYDISRFGIRHLVINNKVAAFDAIPQVELEQATGKNWGPCD